MRISALGGAWLLVAGLAALGAALYYDQAHVAQWTHFAPASTLTQGPAEAETARIFTLIGAAASGAGAAIAAGSAVLAGLAGRVGRWVLRITAVLLLVLMLLIAAALIVGSFTGGAPVAIIDTPWWLLALEWLALAVAVLGAAAATGRLWGFTRES